MKVLLVIFQYLPVNLLRKLNISFFRKFNLVKGKKCSPLLSIEYKKKIVMKNKITNKLILFHELSTIGLSFVCFLNQREGNG